MEISQFITSAAVVMSMKKHFLGDRAHTDLVITVVEELEYIHQALQPHVHGMLPEYVVLRSVI